MRYIYYKIEKQKKYDLEIGRLTNEFVLQRTLSKSYENILSYNQNIKKIVSKKKEIDSTLLSGEFIGKMDYDASRQRYLEAQKGFAQEELNSISSNLNLMRLHNSIQQLQQQKRESLIELEVNINKAIVNLEITINLWEENYVIKSPIKGTLNYLKPLKVNQFVKADENLVIVTPDTISFSVELKIPFSGAGKIKVGQDVNIKLNDYPFNEYGMVNGTIEKISEVANLDHYIGKVNIPNFNKTSYNKPIHIKENTLGIAEIITNDRSWLGRLFERVIYVFRR